MELKDNKPQYWQQPDRIILLDILMKLDEQDKKIQLLHSAIENLHNYITMDDEIDDEIANEETNKDVTFDDV